MDSESITGNNNPEQQPLYSDSIDNKKEDAPAKLDNLTGLQVIGYSVGHFQNDLFAACWFNYLLYFLKNVVFRGSSDSGFYSGIVMLSGQIADGIATPLVGYYSDKTNSRFGKRTPWYVIGTVVVTICYICMWADFQTDNEAGMIAYYIFFPSALNIGWAAVQVAHMSLVPSLTLSRKKRDKLNNLRNTFTYIANLYVLVVAFILFLVLDSDTLQFRVLSFGCLGLGVLSTIFFLFTVKERKINREMREIKKQLKKNNDLPVEVLDGDSKQDELENWDLSEDDKTGKVKVSQVKRKKSMLESMADQDEMVSWKHWFKIPAFYVYAFVYMSVRLLVNLQSSLMIFYLQNVLMISAGDTASTGLPIQFAIIPMIIYLSSTISSFFLKFMYTKIGRKKTFTLGAISAIAGIIIMVFIGPDSKNVIYPTAILIGVGQSISLNTGLTLIGEVVGAKGASGAFVFGAYSLLDKFSSGIILYLVVNLQNVSDPSNSTYIRLCSTIFPGAAIILAWILIMIGKAADYDAGDLVTDQHLEPETEKSKAHVN